MRLAVLFATIASVALAQTGPLERPSLQSATSHWLLNPGGEYSQVVSTGALLGAGNFRVSLQTHLTTTSAIQLREHVVAAFAPLERLQLLAQVPVILLQRPGPIPEVGVGRPWAGARFAIFSPTWDQPLWMSVEAQVGIPGLEQVEGPAVVPRTLPIGLVKVAAAVPSGHQAAIGGEVSARFSQLLLEVAGAATLAARPSIDARGIHFGGELSLLGTLSLLNGVKAFVEVLGGVRYRLRPLELSLLAGPGYNTESGFAFRALFGVSWSNSGEPDDESATNAPRRRPPDCTDGTEYVIADCPDLDWDHDSVVNGVDQCLRVPGEKENAGCPWPDRDVDGTYDPFDNCPDVRGPSKNAGCPEEDPQRVVIKDDRLEILDVIYFEFNSAVIKDQSFELLLQVGKVINAHPELPHLRIEGHTDKVGTAEYNRELSLARANAVKSFLIELSKVEGARLSTRGYGFDRPISEVDSENRRVEFLIIRTPGDAGSAGTKDDSGVDPAP